MSAAGRGGWRSVLLVVPLAVGGGLCAGLAPAWTAAALLGLVGVLVLVSRVEVAVGVFVVASVFEGYLAELDPRTTKVLGAMVAASWVVARCREPGGGLRRVRILQLATGLAVVLLLSSLTAPAAEVGPGLVRWAGFLLVLLVLVDLLHRRRLRARRLVEVYVLAATAAALVGTAGMLLGVTDRASGPVSDANDLAFVLLAALPLALGLRRPGASPGAWDYAAAILAIGLLATFSRGALVGLLAMVVFAAATRLVRPRDLVGLLGLLLAMGSLVVLTQRDRVLEALDHKAAVAGQNVTDRLDLWDAATRMVLDRPLVGHGPGSFALEVEGYALGLPGTGPARLDVVHNTFLEVAVELGLLGLALLVALLLSAGRQSWLAWRARRHPGAAAIATALVGCSVAACFVSEQFALPLWLLMALGATASPQSVPVSLTDRGPDTVRGLELLPVGGAASVRPGAVSTGWR